MQQQKQNREQGLEEEYQSECFSFGSECDASPGSFVSEISDTTSEPFPFEDHHAYHAASSGAFKTSIPTPFGRRGIEPAPEPEEEAALDFKAAVLQKYSLISFL